jgi:hypothetical protein
MASYTSLSHLSVLGQVDAAAVYRLANNDQFSSKVWQSCNKLSFLQATRDVSRSQYQPMFRAYQKDGSLLSMWPIGPWQTWIVQPLACSIPSIWGRSAEVGAFSQSC